LVAAAFAPLAAWDYATAKRIFWWGGLAAILGASWCVGRWVLPDAAGPPSARVALAFAVVAAMAPTHIALRHGQTTPFVAGLIALYVAASVRQRPVTAGVALGIACLVKFPPLILLGLDATKGRSRTVTACLVTIVSAVSISLVVFGPRLHAAYERGIAGQAGQVMAAHNNQSLAAVATRMLGEAPHQDWSPRPLGTSARVLTELAAVALLGLVAWGVLSAKQLAYEVPAALSLGIVVLPVAWDHYVLMLAPALVAMAAHLAARDHRSRAPLVAAMVIAYALLALPTPGPWIDAAVAGGPVEALVLSHYFIGLLIVLGVAVAALRTESRA
jgi:hypothetical protein